MTTTELVIPTEALIAFCKRNQITYLGLFGSAARGAMRPDSDVDILVEWAPERRFGLIEYSRQQEELTLLFGRRVDLVQRSGLKPVIRESVINSALTLYAA